MQAATPLNLSKHRLRCFQLSKEFETVNSLLFRNLQNDFHSFDIPTLKLFTAAY